MTLDRPPWDSAPPPTPRCAQCGRVLDLKHGSNVDEWDISLCLRCGELTRAEHAHLKLDEQEL